MRAAPAFAGLLPWRPLPALRRYERQTVRLPPSLVPECAERRMDDSSRSPDLRLRHPKTDSSRTRHRHFHRLSFQSLLPPFTRCDLRIYPLQPDHMNHFPGKVHVPAVDFIRPGLAGIRVEERHPALVKSKMVEIVLQLRIRRYPCSRRVLSHILSSGATAPDDRQQPHCGVRTKPRHGENNKNPYRLDIKSMAN